MKNDLDSGLLLEKARAVFAADKYLMLTGVRIDEVGADSCRCSLVVEPQHMNAGGAAQGGAVYTLADSAFAVACNIGHLERGEALITVSQSASISYLRAVPLGAKLEAFAQKVGGGKRSSVYRIDVTAEDGKPVATMTGNAVTVPKR
ncbi:MAG: PaaI family thioesterase [Clostridiales Family XIII bacterium]|jgi:acyl-CoA thioesterase|nr:PaaI family thioesterase [Clostridiales Family XIII bacterium]